jgi:hypothetical protein
MTERHPGKGRPGISIEAPKVPTPPTKTSVLTLILIGARSREAQAARAYYRLLSHTQTSLFRVTLQPSPDWMFKRR